MELMPLKIPSGYAVCYNEFYDIDPEISQDEDELLKNWEYFTEDILQIRKMIIKNGEWISNPDVGYIIDLGWYQDGNINGEYDLKLAILKDKEWNIIKEFKSRNRFKIRDTIEEWMKLYIKENREIK